MNGNPTARPSDDLVRYLRDTATKRMIFAVGLNVSLDSVHRWCRGEQLPSPEHAELIYTRTNGAVDFRRERDEGRPSVA